MIDPKLKAKIDSGEINTKPAAERYQFYLEAARAGFIVTIQLFRDAAGQMREVVQFEEEVKQ